MLKQFESSSGGNEITLKVVKVFLALGILIRLCYTLFTSAGTRTYDVYRDQWGHLDYIKYIAQNISLPPVNDCQAYHPPVHHIIAAFSFNQSRHFTLNENVRLKVIQLVMVLLSSLTLYLFYKMLKELKCSNVTILTATALFAFHPVNIYFSSRINNDNTLLFFYTLAFYFMIKWMNSHSYKDIIFLAVSAALAALSKFSGFILVPVIGCGFITTLYKNWKENITYLRQFTLFGLLYVPLSMSYQIRNYVLFGQHFGYVPSLGKGFTPTFYNLVALPVDEIIKSPYNHGGLKGGEFFLEFLLKSSLFGEWEYPGLEILAYPLLILSVILILCVLAYLLVSGKRAGNLRYLFILNLIIPILLAIKFRWDFPVACSQDFRYIAPVLISLAYFLGDAINRLRLRNQKLLANTLLACIMTFCFLSSVFVLSLGYYN